MKVMNNQDKLILIYLNNNKEYFINDLLELLGFTYDQLYLKIMELVDSEYLCIADGAVVEITKKGFDYLNVINLVNTTLKKLCTRNLKINELTEDELYIPSKFEKRFKLYYNVDN